MLIIHIFILKFSKYFFYLFQKEPLSEKRERDLPKFWHRSPFQKRERGICQNFRQESNLQHQKEGKQLLHPKRDERIKKSGLTQENLEFLIKRGALERCFPLQKNKKVWRIELKNWESLPDKVIPVKEYLVSHGLKGNEKKDKIETFLFRLSDTAECEPFALVEDLDGYFAVGASSSSSSSSSSSLSPQEMFRIQMGISENDFHYLTQNGVFTIISEGFISFFLIDCKSLYSFSFLSLFFLFSFSFLFLRRNHFIADGEIQWGSERGESIVFNALLSLKLIGEQLSFEVEDLLEDFGDDEVLKVVSVRGELYVIKSVLIRERPDFSDYFEE